MAYGVYPKRVQQCPSFENRVGRQTKQATVS